MASGGDRPRAVEDEPAWLGRAVWGFVALGLLFRVAVFAADPPLWGDEACLAYNLLGRGYRDLLRPLDYGQVAPPLFLWAERAVVGVLGFSEATLRLVPLLCALASVLLFRRLAGLALDGVPRLLAVAVFAVSVHPIRHAADVKPYATDVLMAIALLIPAFAWLRDRGRDGSLWALAALAPVALLTSYPAVFVAGGVAIALAGPVWRTGRPSARLALAAFGLATAATSLVVVGLVARGQDRAVRAWMDLYWARAYPPTGAWAFARWLVLSVTGSMLSYPDGGRDGGSVGTFACVAVAVVTLARSRRRAELVLLLAPFALTLLASAGHRYPFGGEARTMQFVAPAVCLLGGLGLAKSLRLVPRPGAVAAALALLAALGLAETGGFLRKPYRSLYDARVRDFARSFWPAQARDAEVACVRWDFGVVEHLYARRDVLNGRTPGFVCNAMIADPTRRDGPRLDRVSAGRPLRCVLFQETSLEQPEAAAWFASMTGRYDLARFDTVEVDVGETRSGRRVERVFLFDFVPRRVASGAVEPRDAGR